MFTNIFKYAIITILLIIFIFFFVVVLTLIGILPAIIIVFIEKIYVILRLLF